MHQFDRKFQADDSPLALLYQRYAQIILTYLRGHVTSKEDAEDLLLDVFIAALQNQTPLYLEDSAQLAWLRHVAHNKVIDYHRRTARRPIIPLDAATDALFDDEEQTPEQAAFRHEVQAQLRACIATLPELHQEILQLRFAHGLQSKEIGKLLNKSDGAIRMLLSRILNLLRDIYKEY